MIKSIYYGKYLKISKPTQNKSSKNIKSSTENVTIKKVTWKLVMGDSPKEK